MELSLARVESEKKQIKTQSDMFRSERDALRKENLAMGGESMILRAESKVPSTPSPHHSTAACQTHFSRSIPLLPLAHLSLVPLPSHFYSIRSIRGSVLQIPLQGVRDDPEGSRGPGGVQGSRMIWRGPGVRHRRRKGSRGPGVQGSGAAEVRHPMASETTCASRESRLRPIARSARLGK